ncbi:MAG: enoyl-CoA hydratase-related protein [Bdellovibrionia bacterium]
MKFVIQTELNNVAYVKLHRPEMRNAFNPEMIQEITQCFLVLAARKDLRAVVLSGEGKAFCAGADLNWMKEMVDFSLEQNREDSLKLFNMFEAIWNCPLPIVGQIHGSVFGGALGLLACCDYVIAEEGTQFCFSEVKLGIAPAVISAFIHKKAQMGRARFYMLSGKVFGADEAMAMSLVHEKSPAGEAHHAVQRVLHLFQQVGPQAAQETKKLLNSLYELSWDQQKTQTAAVIADRRVSDEGQEGLKSFIEKREPSWRGGLN